MSYPVIQISQNNRHVLCIAVHVELASPTVEQLGSSDKDGHAHIKYPAFRPFEYSDLPKRETKILLLFQYHTTD